MSYLVLARKWRPQAFEDVTGQEHVVQTLANAIAQGRVAHALLLCGPRGVGKTTTARLLARALNCESGPTAQPCGTCLPCTEITQGHSVDVVEIDGASNNSVDNVREIRETVRYLPQRDRYKVFIIDEVHMLSVAAFNALLKTLEEPPPHVKFIFATTDPQKLPDTILSRCQRHNFRRVSGPQMVQRLRTICDQEGITVSDAVLQAIAKEADGGMRDSLSLLDQLVSSSGLAIDDEAAAQVLGLVDAAVVGAIAGALLARDGKGVVEALDGAFDRGIDPKKLCEELAQRLRDLLYCKSVGRAPPGWDAEAGAALQAQAEGADVAQLTRLFDLVHGAIRDLSFAARPRLALEVALLSAVHMAPAQGLADLAASLERLAAGGGASAQAANPAGMPGAGLGAGFAGAGVSQPPPQQARPPQHPQAQHQRQAPGSAPSQHDRGPALTAEDLIRQVEARAGGGAARQQRTRAAPKGQAPMGSDDDEPHRAAPPAHAEPPRGQQAAPPPMGRGPQTPPPYAEPPRGQQGGSSPVRPGPESPRMEPPRTQRASQPPGSRPRQAPPPARPEPQRPPQGAAPPWEEEPPPWADEPPPWIEEEAPGRFFPQEASPGGCASGACDAPDPAPSFAPDTGPRPSATPGAGTGPGAGPHHGSGTGSRPGPGDDPTLSPGARWRRFLESIRDTHAVLYPMLAEGRLNWLRDGEIALAFSAEHGFHLESMRGGDFRRQVDELLSRWFGRQMRLRLEVAGDDAPVSVAEEERRRLEERASKLRAEAREHPTVQLVQSLLSGEIQGIDVEDPR